MASFALWMAQSAISLPSTVCSRVALGIKGTSNYVALSASATAKQTKEAVYKSVQMSWGVAKFSLHVASRPFIWPTELSLDLSRRITLQILYSVREILQAIDDYVVFLDLYLSHQTKYIGYGKGDLMVHNQCEECKEQKTSLEAARLKIMKLCYQKVADAKQRKATNNSWRRKVKCAEYKYETLRAELSALRIVYSDKLSDLENERDEVEDKRRKFLGFIGSAEKLAKNCRCDVQNMMDDLYELASTPVLGVSTGSLDLSYEELACHTDPYLLSDGEENAEMCDKAMNNDIQDQYNLASRSSSLNSLLSAT